MITCKRKKQWRDTPEFYSVRMMISQRSWKDLLTQMKYSDNNSIEEIESWVFRTKTNKNSAFPMLRSSTLDLDLQSKIITLALPSDVLPHLDKQLTPKPRPEELVATNNKATAVEKQDKAIDNKKPDKADKSHLQENRTNQEEVLH